MTNDFLKYARADYVEPDGYTEVDSLRKMYVPSKGNYLGMIPVNLVHQQKDILIGMFFMPYKEKSELKKKVMMRMHNAANPQDQKTFEDYQDIENQWQNIVKINNDTLQGTGKGLEEYYKLKSNTDTVVVFPMKIERKYHGKYTKCKYVIAHKRNRGTASIYYFYTDEVDPKEVDKEIKRTWGFIRFKE